jgi:hypothetical protein
VLECLPRQPGPGFNPQYHKGKKKNVGGTAWIKSNIFWGMISPPHSEKWLCLGGAQDFRFDSESWSSVTRRGVPLVCLSSHLGYGASE